MTVDERRDLADLIADEVRAARARAGLDQRIVADLAGVSVRFLRSVEHGKASVRLDKLLPVLEVLGLRLREESVSVATATEDAHDPEGPGAA